MFRRHGDAVVYLVIRDRYDNWGFPKGHLESGEEPASAALREVGEETGLDQLVLYGSVGMIDWYFTFRGVLIHKFCHFFLIESPLGEPTPQSSEGITACRWASLDEALDLVAYANARSMLRQGAELLDRLVRTPDDRG